MPLRLRSPSVPRTTTSPQPPPAFSFALSPTLTATDAVPPERDPPAYRLDKELMPVVGGRPGDEWDCEELGKGILSCRTCGKPVLESAVGVHAQNCTAAIRLEAALAARRAPGSNAKGKGLKRRNSDVSVSASEGSTVMSNLTPSKRAKLGPPAKSSFVRSTSATSLALDGGGGSGVGEPAGERMMLENGKYETKKQMVKRLGQERKEAKAAEKERRERGGVVEDGLEIGSILPKKKPPKGPKEFHPDRCCGVLITEGAMAGSQCSRKLDCKIHTVGHKREVLGRSMSFDDCLRNMRVEAGQVVPEKPAKVKHPKSSLGPGGGDKAGNDAGGGPGASANGGVTKTPKAKKNKSKTGGAAGGPHGHLANGSHKHHAAADAHDAEFPDAQSAAIEFDLLVRAVRHKTCRIEEVARSTLLEWDSGVQQDNANGRDLKQIPPPGQNHQGLNGLAPPPHIANGSISPPFNPYGSSSSMQHAGTRGIFGGWHLERKRLAVVTEGLLSDIVYNVGADLERRVRMGRQSVSMPQQR